MPPKYSAIKIGGKRALNKVLNQEDFEMQKRQCKIYEIELLSLKYQTASFRALVSP
ncbi:MAG: hypothetical protein LBU14_03040 [Candidatus Peribacteria bacterium]|nr:hypothetical protein [Candidatus Peribacteria bacterium]